MVKTSIETSSYSLNNMQIALSQHAGIPNIDSYDNF